MEDNKDMTYRELTRKYRAKGYRLKSYGKIKEKCVQHESRGKVRKNRSVYTLYKLVINPRHKKTLLITTGFHGEEFNGPISLLEIIDVVADIAKKARLRIVIYICVNPSGFDLHQRYNASGEKQNNDFMRYVIKGGKLVGMLKKGEPYMAINIIDSPAREVRLLKRDALKYFSPVPRGVLDIHQQEGHLKNGDVFAYIFNRRPVYLRIMKKISRIAKIAKNDPTFTWEGRRKVYYRIDENGFIFLHDGSITDMFYRLGSKFVVTSETKTTMSLADVCAVNLIWIEELIKLIVKK